MYDSVVVKKVFGGIRNHDSGVLSRFRVCCRDFVVLFRRHLLSCVITRRHFLCLSISNLFRLLFLYEYIRVYVYPTDVADLFILILSGLRAIDYFFPPMGVLFFFVCS